MLIRLLRAEGQSRSARTVELFGWFDLTLGLLILIAPIGVASVLDLPTLSWQAANYVRLVGLLVGGLGMLYVVSGRLNAEGFVFASMLDRPMVAAVIVGARSRAHLSRNVALSALPLTAADQAEIDTVLAERKGPVGDTFELERDRAGRHGAIMKYNLNAVDA